MARLVFELPEPEPEPSVLDDVFPEFVELVSIVAFDAVSVAKMYPGSVTVCCFIVVVMSAAEAFSTEGLYQ